MCERQNIYKKKYFMFIKHERKINCLVNFSIFFNTIIQRWVKIEFQFFV